MNYVDRCRVDYISKLQFYSYDKNTTKYQQILKYYKYNDK